jgi:hypothetical protein
MKEDKAKDEAVRVEKYKKSGVMYVVCIKIGTTTAWYPKEAAVLGDYPQHAMHA